LLQLEAFIVWSDLAAPPVVGPPGDETIILTPPRKPRAWGKLAAGSTGVLAAAVALWLLWPQHLIPPSPPETVQPPGPAPQVQAPVVPPPAFALQTAPESEIRTHESHALTVFRFAPNPDIVVLDFPTLLEQGLMLNRVAALVEKAGLPRDRVLTDTELDAAIRQHGDTIETFYYGHDYPASALTRFFELADRNHVQLNGQEEKLRHLLQQLGWLTPGIHGGLISIPQVGADANVTMSARSSILRHELSHGEFFSNPAYADYVRRFWQANLTEKERTGMRRFLGSQEYDVADEDLMLNEMQAYLMFTLDPHFFRPADVGMTEERRNQLQAEFLRGLDVAWLRDTMQHKLAVTP